MQFLIEQWRDHLPPEYLLKKASIDTPFEEDACRCHFVFVKDRNVYDEAELALRLQWFIGEKTPTNFEIIKEGSSLDWECDMSEEEEDLILRMYKLIGNKWSLIAGRIPGRKEEEIERYWAMRTQQFCGSHGATIFASNKQMGNMISIPYHINGCNDVEVNS